MGVKQIFAPSYHLSSVGLVERYVQMVLAVLRTMLQHSQEFIFSWDAFMPHVSNAINTKVIRIHGYSPAQLLLGFEPKYVAGMESLNDEIRGSLIAANVEEMMTQGSSPDEAHHTVRLASIDEIRHRAIERRLQEQERTALKTERTGESASEGDLVLVRRLAQDNQHSHKLELRWEGLYIVTRVEEHRKSVWVHPLQSEKLKGKYHMNDIKIFVKRTENNSEFRDWRTVAEINEGVRTQIRKWMEHRSVEQKKKKQEWRNEGKDPRVEERREKEKLAREWWNKDRVAYAGAALRENEDYWTPKAVNLHSLQDDTE